MIAFLMSPWLAGLLWALDIAVWAAIVWMHLREYWGEQAATKAAERKVRLDREKEKAIRFRSRTAPAATLKPNYPLKSTT